MNPVTRRRGCRCGARRPGRSAGWCRAGGARRPRREARRGAFFSVDPVAEQGHHVGRIHVVGVPQSSTLEAIHLNTPAAKEEVAAERHVSAAWGDDFDLGVAQGHDVAQVETGLRVPGEAADDLGEGARVESLRLGDAVLGEGHRQHLVHAALAKDLGAHVVATEANRSTGVIALR